MKSGHDVCCQLHDELRFKVNFATLSTFAPLIQLCDKVLQTFKNTASNRRTEHLLEPVLTMTVTTESTGCTTVFQNVITLPTIFGN
jgi:hypothetical protein